MDYSSMLKMSYELNPDRFEAGRIYKIKIHTPELFSKALGVSLYGINGIDTTYKNLYNLVNEFGIDTICIMASTKFVEFITSTRSVNREIVTRTINISLEDILEANDSMNNGVKPAIEIL